MRNLLHAAILFVTALATAGAIAEANGAPAVPVVVTACGPETARTQLVVAQRLSNRYLEHAVTDIPYGLPHVG